MPSVLFLLACYSLVGNGANGSPIVHMVPHAHCDPGYRESFQGYYDKQVHNILDTMLIALNSSSSRRFVWEESSFLSYWWEKNATDQQKSLMKKLVDEKRLEMIGGGWTMHDEAVNNVPTILNQMQLGLKFVKDNLGVRPKHEWHIDPFGHSLMMPELYSALQYDALVINRIPDDIKQQMKKDQSLEFYWKSSFTGASIFTHVLDNHYTTPVISGNTMSEKAQSLVDTCNKRLKWYRTDHLLVPFGGDFNFQNASDQFQGMEEIMKYVNMNSDKFKLSMQFSTLDDYFSAVTKSARSATDFPVFADVDFFPYIACYPCGAEVCGEGIPCGFQTPYGYWSGFYTSKPAQKLLAREQETSLAELDNLNSFYPFLHDAEYDVFYETQALLTHHDAITGTSFPSCYVDYNERLEMSLALQRIIVGQIKFKLLCVPKKEMVSFTNDTVYVLDSLLDDSNVGIIAVFNNLMETRSDYVRVALPKDVCVKVMSSSGDTLDFQQVGTTLYVPLTIDPFELKTFLLSKVKCPTKQKFFNLVGSTILSNGYLQLTFNDNHHVSSLSNLHTKESIDLSLSFTEVFEEQASTDSKHQSVCDGSNVYTFVPDISQTPKPLSPSNQNVSTVLTGNGPLVWEVQQEISSAGKDGSCPVRMILRLFKPISDDPFFQQFMEIQNTVGPLEEDYPNSIVFSAKTSLDTGSKFTTYTSGLYPMAREYNSSRPSQANYYPLVGRVSMMDEKKDVAVVMSTKRPMGVTSKDGTLDLLVHRRIALKDDPRGNDTSVMADPMYLGLVPSNDVNEISYRAMAYSQSPLSAYATVENSSSVWNKYCNSSFSPLLKQSSLPQEVKLLSMQVLSFKSAVAVSKYDVGIRLVNIGSSTVKVDLSKIFAHYRLVYVSVTTPDFGIIEESLKSGIWELPPYKFSTAIMTLQIVQ